MQTDDLVGQIVKALDEKGISENTMLIVTSDNGCSRAADFKSLESHGHFASAQYRGSKAMQVKIARASCPFSKSRKRSSLAKASSITVAVGISLIEKGSIS